MPTKWQSQKCPHSQALNESLLKLSQHKMTVSVSVVDITFISNVMHSNTRRFQYGLTPTHSCLLQLVYVLVQKQAASSSQPSTSMYFGWQEAYRLSLRQLVHTMIITASTNDIQNTYGNALVKGRNGMIFEAPWIKNKRISYVQEQTIIDLNVNCAFIWLNAKIVSMEFYPRPIFTVVQTVNSANIILMLCEKKGRKHQN